MILTYRYPRVVLLHKLEAMTEHPEWWKVPRREKE